MCVDFGCHTTPSFFISFFFLMAHLTCCFSLASFNDHMCFTTNENGGCILVVVVLVYCSWRKSGQAGCWWSLCSLEGSNAYRIPIKKILIAFGEFGSFYRERNQEFCKS